MPAKSNIPNTNNRKASDYSSLLKNLENIKSEFITLREYVGDRTDGLQEKISKKTIFKLMYGRSDMVKHGGELIGIGFDYKLAKPLKLYLNYVDKSYTDTSKDSEHIMFGIQYKFSFDML